VAHEVGQLAGVSGATIGQWANYGYIKASQSEPGQYPKVYSYQDVAEAIVVHELLEQKVPLEALRPVIEQLRSQYGDWPLQHAHLETLSTAEINVAALIVGQGRLLLELGDHGWQIVENATINPHRVSVDLSRGGWALRSAPDITHVEVDPDRHSGAPVIRGRRVPVALVVELSTSFEGTEVLHEDYEVTDAEIQDAQRWWSLISSYDAATAA
jgi:uncharacterized protein (DUF433 family)/DNA-binding transcriptional MerR regulator